MRVISVIKTVRNEDLYISNSFPINGRHCLQKATLPIIRVQYSEQYVAGSRLNLRIKVYLRERNIQY